MTRNRLLFFALSAILVLPIVAASLLGAAARQEDGDGDSLYKYLSVFTEVLSLVRQTYVEEIDLQALVAGSLDATTDALDPFSLFVPASAVNSYLAARSVGTRHSGLLLLRQRGVTFVVAVAEGSPAAAAGIQMGDIVSRIDGRTTRLLPLWSIQEILAGTPGTRVALGLLRLGETVEAEIVLGPYEAPPVRLDERRGVRILRVSAFRPETVGEVERALAVLDEENRRQLLLDLRSVTEGEPGTAYQVAGLFAAGKLGSLNGRDGSLQEFASETPKPWSGELVVLINRATLGPAEILATILQQKAGASLVGEKSFGYAGRQELATLGNGSRLLLTTAFYAGPDGQRLTGGLEPDLPVDAFHRRFGEKDTPLNDLILERGLGLLLGEEELPAKKAA